MNDKETNAKKSDENKYLDLGPAVCSCMSSVDVKTRGPAATPVKIEEGTQDK